MKSFYATLSRAQPGDWVIAVITPDMAPVLDRALSVLLRKHVVTEEFVCEGDLLMVRRGRSSHKV